MGIKFELRLEGMFSNPLSFLSGPITQYSNMQLVPLGRVWSLSFFFFFFSFLRADIIEKVGNWCFTSCTRSSCCSVSGLLSVEELKESRGERVGKGA